MKIYVRKELEKYCENIKNLKSRYYVNHITTSLRLLEDNENKTYCITGLDKTGKTTALLQIISNLTPYGQYGDSVLILLESNDDFDIGLLYSIVRKQNKKYVFIDNIDRLIKWDSAKSDLEKLKKFNNLSANIVFTSSINLELSYGELFNYNDIINFVEYSEFEVLTGKKAKSYIKNNSINSANYSIPDLISNIVDLCKSDINIKYTKNINCRLSSASYTVLCGIEYLNLCREQYSKDGCIREHIYNTYSKIEDFLYKFTEDEVLLAYDGSIRFSKISFYSSAMGVKTYKKDIIKVLNALIKNKILIEIKDLKGESFSDYYFTNNNIAKQILKRLPKEYKDGVYDDAIYDALIKNSLATNIYNTNNIMGLETYSFNDIIISTIKYTDDTVHIKQCINTFDTIHYTSLVDFDAHLNYLERFDEKIKSLKIKGKKPIVVSRYIIEVSMKQNKTQYKNNIDIIYSGLTNFFNFMLYN